MRLIRYKIDSMADENGHKVIRLTPHHCIYIPIEPIRAQVKGFVADNNNKHKMTEVANLTKDVIKTIYHLKSGSIVLIIAGS